MGVVHRCINALGLKRRTTGAMGESSVRRVRREVEHIVGKTLWQTLDITGDAIAGTAGFVFTMISNFEIFAILFLVAEAIIWARWFVVHFSFVAEACAFIIEGVFKVAKVVFDIIRAILCWLPSWLCHSCCPPHATKASKAQIMGSDYSGPWWEHLQDVPTKCKAYDTPPVRTFFGGFCMQDSCSRCRYTDWQEVFGFFSGQFTKNNVCVFLRYVEPVDWLYS